MEKCNSIAIYLCNSFFPYGRAYSSRVMNFCKLFISLGITPYVVADFGVETTDRGGREINGIKYYIIGNTSKKYIYLKKTRVGINAIKSIISANSSKKIYIVVSAADVLRFKRLKEEYKHSLTIHLILESCEWYDKSSYLFSSFDPRFLLFQYQLHHEYLKSNKIIAISRYLERFFDNGRNKVIRIPTILDTFNEKWTSETKNPKIVLMFAGSMGGNKELFLEVLNALIHPDYINDFEFHVYGGTVQTLKACLGKSKTVVDRLKGVVFCHGFVNQTLIEEAYRNADYSIVFRPDRKSSHAGFPTKLAESMIAGTPVIANATGDVDLYINNTNGLIVDYDYMSICTCFSLLKKMSTEEKKKMRQNARKTAEKYFDYRQYKIPFSYFLDS